MLNLIALFRIYFFAKKYEIRKQKNKKFISAKLICRFVKKNTFSETFKIVILNPFYKKVVHDCLYCKGKKGAPKSL